MGFGMEILLVLVFGLLLLGPKRLPAILGGVARAKAQLEHAGRSFKSQMEAAESGNRATNFLQKENLTK